MRPLISCIVPVFNGEKYLAEALDSIVGQGYRPIEVIVADDGSTDGSEAVVAAYGEPVRWVSQVTAGPAATRNLGVQSARGEVLAFLDADDLWHKDKLERQWSRFVERPELEACVSHVQLFWVNELGHEAEQYCEHPRSQAMPGFATTTLLAKWELFDRVGLFNTGLWFSDATEWFIRCRELGVVLEVLPEVLTFHRMHGSNLTRRRSEASKAEFNRVVRESLEWRRKRA